MDELALLNIISKKSQTNSEWQWRHSKKISIATITIRYFNNRQVTPELKH